MTTTHITSASKLAISTVALDPNGHKEGMPIYYHVDAGVRQLQEIKDLGDAG